MQALSESKGWKEGWLQNTKGFLFPLSIWKNQTFGQSEIKILVKRKGKMQEEDFK